jgi:ATP-dependent HslUV protease subunit HslV
VSSLGGLVVCRSLLSRLWQENAVSAILIPWPPQIPVLVREKPMKTYATTILTVRHKGVVAMGGDGQVSLGDSIMKADANKIRRLMDDRVITGFAGASADAFALLERFEAKLKEYPSNVPRAATELAKEWRTDRVLRRLEALMAVVDARHTLLVSGNGDVIQPTDGVLGIGSGGNYAVAAARALLAHSPLGAGEIVRAALLIAAGIDVHTNANIVVEELACET